MLSVTRQQRRQVTPKMSCYLMKKQAQVRVLCPSCTKPNGGNRIAFNGKRDTRQHFTGNYSVYLRDVKADAPAVQKQSRL